MLVAAAVCPHPPLLIPALAGLDSTSRYAPIAALRRSAVDTVRALLATTPDLLIVVGDAPATGCLEPPVYADFRPFGADRVLGDVTALRLPPALAVGRWLLAEAGWRPPGEPNLPALPDADRERCGHCASQGGEVATTSSAVAVGWQGVARGLEATDAARLGAAGAGRRPRVAMLVMGDGSARRSAGAPGAFDPAAEPLDGEIAVALGAADGEALLALDRRRCEAQLVAGRASWQVLAGAARSSGGRWKADLVVHEAPFGVGYFIARWRRA